MDGETRRDFVSRERYDLLLEEAQAVERERARLESEVQKAEVHRAGLERDLGHAQESLGRLEEAREGEREALTALQTQLAEARTERAVDRVRLERLEELSARVADLEEANAKLAFALKDASQGYRQVLLGAGGEGAPGRTTGRAARSRRLVTLGAAAAGLALLVVGGFQLGELRSSLAAERDARRSRDEDARGELSAVLSASERRAEELREAHAAQLRLAEEAAAARTAALEARLGEDRAEWRAERTEILDALDERGEELERLAAAVEARAAAPSETPAETSPEPVESNDPAGPPAESTGPKGGPVEPPADVVEAAEPEIPEELVGPPVPPR